VQEITVPHIFARVDDPVQLCSRVKVLLLMHPAAYLLVRWRGSVAMLEARWMHRRRTVPSVGAPARVWQHRRWRCTGQERCAEAALALRTRRPGLPSHRLQRYVAFKIHFKFTSLADSLRSSLGVTCDVGLGLFVTWLPCCGLPAPARPLFSLCVLRLFVNTRMLLSFSSWQRQPQPLTTT